MSMQTRGSKAGGALRLSLPCKSSVVIPGSPSARLNRGLKLNAGQWLLRFSVLRETHMTSTTSITFQKAKMLRRFHKTELTLVEFWTFQLSG
jgi:hypothetical protein